jgi:YidC/Oxa1 family membrane protein insertase
MNEQNRRLLLTVVMCMAVYTVWAYFFGPKPRPPGAPQTTAQTATSTSPGAATALAPVAAANTAAPAGAPAGDVPRETVALPRPPTRKLTLTSDKLKLVVTTDGGELESAVLLGAKFRKPAVKETPASQLELVGSVVRPLPLATQLVAADGKVLLGTDAGYEVVEESPRSLTLRARAPGLEVTRKLELDPQTYRLNVTIDVKSDVALDGKLTVTATGFADPNINSGMFSQRSDPTQVICQAGGKTERMTHGAKTPTWDGPGPAVFAGISEQYFLTALVPEAGRSTCRIEADARGWLKANIDTPVKVSAGGTWSQTLAAYAGPKDTEELGAVAAPLRESVDFGFWAVIANFLLVVMKFFYKVFPIHNWGVAIILLTLSVKAVTFPLQWKSMKSMQEMQRIQPQIEELKKRLGGDTQRFNEEQMKLFKEHGVNPMGGCLPMVIQMPVWFALYTTLRVSVELYNSMFIPGWLVDLTSIDPYYILPVAMGATMLLTQILTPQPMSNPSQKTIGYVMTAVFSVMMVNLPSGLTLYIFTNNILSIAMQMYLKRALNITPPIRPAAA